MKPKGKGNRTAEQRARRTEKKEIKRQRMSRLLQRRAAEALLKHPDEEQSSSDGSINNDEANPLEKLRMVIGSGTSKERRNGRNVPNPNPEDESKLDAAPASVIPKYPFDPTRFESHDPMSNIFCTTHCAQYTNLFMDHLIQYVLSRKNEVLTRTRQLEGNEIQDDEECIRDSGYTPCVALVLLPMRNAAFDFVTRLLSKIGCSFVKNMDKFRTEFGPLEEQDVGFHKRPEDHKALFSGNVDDKFCIGLTLLPDKTKAYLYSKFVACDVLIASPLGLCHYLNLGEEGVSSNPAEVEGGGGSAKNYIIASIEVLYAAPLEMFFYQNWQRFLDVISAVNGTVVASNTACLGDFSRLKPCFVDGTGKRHRQNVLLAGLAHPYFNSLFRSVTSDSLRPQFEDHLPAEAVHPTIDLLHSPHALRQYFIRVSTSTPTLAHQERLAYFKAKFYPTKLVHYINSQIPTILFVPSYFDFVALRAFFEENLSESYTELCEYTPVRDRKIALRDFSDGNRSLLIMTERFYFFRRHYVRGAAVLVFYEPPVTPLFYSELVNKLNFNDPSVCAMTLFSKFDMQSILRIVGRDRMNSFYSQTVNGDSTSVFTIV